ncbi:hypothetical protein LCGC14_0258940 [marine sediment metagenome]|uniref:Uncharacterized protein n=1 Tax=marine sediment metagenome TaxID=412755 RepID=A0A0F9U761_9ZZZZ
MSNIIQPGLSHLISTMDLARIEDAVHKAVMRSAELRGQKMYTEGKISHSEYDRRAKYCIELALRWRKERRFALEQIGDALKTALISWIDGDEYEPRDGMWADPDQNNPAGTL